MNRGRASLHLRYGIQKGWYTKRDRITPCRERRRLFSYYVRAIGSEKYHELFANPSIMKIFHNLHIHNFEVGMRKVLYMS